MCKTLFSHRALQQRRRRRRGRHQGLLGEHAQPHLPPEEGGGAEASGHVLQRGHAQVPGEARSAPWEITT